MSKLQRHIRWSPAWDKRNDDPAKNYGIHGVELRFILSGPAGATQFVIYTNWHLPHVAADLKRKHADTCLFEPMGADVGYHSKVPMYDDQEAMDGNCEFTGGACYYDGSGLAAGELFNEFVAKGEDVVWQKLEERYRELEREISTEQEESK